MAFSGHETFAVREGWLHKGLKLLVEQPELLTDEFSHDWLGVGKNMSRSIKHWLFVTGLAHRESTRRNARLSPTDLGQLVWREDPYFNEIGTLWALHVNLVQPRSIAETWAWFFGQFNLSRFEKSGCVETLRRHLEISGLKAPSISTLDRDVSCLLSFYSRQIPAEDQDPEDANDCPFRDLGLMSHFRASGYYQLNQGSKDFSPELLCYAIAQALKEADELDPGSPVPVVTLSRLAGGPARAFLLSPEALFEAASRAEGELATDEATIGGLAGNRTLQIDAREPIEWLASYYRRIGGEKRAA